MGFFADFKAKRADKRAKQEFDYLHYMWQEDITQLDKLIEVFTAAAKGEDSVANTLMQQPGEIALWTGHAVFHETGRTPTHYVGGSTGVSIPIGGGIRFRVGAMKGTAVPGDAFQMDKDEGVVMLTTERLVFAGPVQTQEWNFDKLLMLSTTPDESDYFISVSNRKATSGVRFTPEVGREFNRFLGSATAALESGIAPLLEELESLKENATAAEPKLILRSSVKAIEQ
jgi:hypothetical protein